MKKSLLILFLFFIAQTYAQNYNVALIPDSLKKNANAVVRISEMIVNIKNGHKTIIKSKTAITILNEDGNYLAAYSGYYDKFRSISDISGVLFDAEGTKIKSIKKKDISDVSISDGYSLVTDARTKYFAFYNRTYPYTVEFEDVVEYDGTYTIIPWFPVSHKKTSVQNSIYTLQIDEDFKVNYRQYNYQSEPKITNEKGRVIMTWQLSNYQAIEPEIYSPEWREITPVVFFAPSEFELGGYKGSMASWKDFGLFSKQLNQNRDVLPENIKKTIHEISDKLTTTAEKVTALYDYLQKNTRYISIQLGIGGLQPFEAKYVAEKKYGDCKALSNYMVSILKEAGITSYYTLVAAGEDESKNVIEDFPRDYFNHIITCVPNGNDTIWLECTSSTKSAGYMGKFTGNRKALVITEEGGSLVSTPIYTSKDNQQIRKVDAALDAQGNLLVNAKTIFTGIEQELAHTLKNELNQEYRKKYLNSYISLPTYEVEKNEYIEKKGKIPVMEEYLKINSQNYANVSGKRLFITPNLFNRNNKLSNDKPRKFDIEYDNAFIEIDTIQIKILEGYTTESMPKNVELKNKFGVYKIQFAFVGNNTIEMIRYYERNSGKYPKTVYEELVKFYDDMYKADRSKIVLVKKD